MNTTTTPMADPEIDGLLATWLRGEAGTVPMAARAALSDRFLERIDFHGVAGLLYARMHDQAIWPDPLRDALRDRAIALAFWEANHVRVLGRLLEAMGQQGIAPLIFKGTALAYAHYAEPATRARGDTDLLVAENKFGQACEILGHMGFSTQLTERGDAISAQKTFTYMDGTGTEHDIDLHARLNNSAVLARLFDFNELERRSIALPGLGDGARGIAPVDALLIASMHRMVHLQSPYFVNDIAYRSANRLIWLFDIHLLVQSFTAADWIDFEQRATEKELAATCADGLRRAQSALGTTLPADVLLRLESVGARETPTAYLLSGAVGRIVRNLRAKRGLRNKARFLVELFFPPADYMRTRYGAGRVRWLPWLYVVRLFGKFRRELGSKDAPRS